MARFGSGYTRRRNGSRDAILWAEVGQPGDRCGVDLCLQRGEGIPGGRGKRGNGFLENVYKNNGYELRVFTERAAANQFLAKE
jgi:hypothetical protein